MTLDEFKKSDKSLLILLNDEIMFESKKDALIPLVEFIKSNKPKENLLIFDKYIGRAAALLMTLLIPIKVYTPIISQFGRQVFEQHQIEFYAEQEVEYLMGVASETMCKWEKLSVGKNAEELFEILTN